MKDLREARQLEAIRWLEQLRDPELTAESIRQWQCWLAASTENAATFKKVQALFADLGEIDPSWPTAEELRANRAKGRRVVWPASLSIAAAMTAIAVGVVFFWKTSVPQVTLAANNQSLATSRAQDRRFKLSDGSEVTIGALSQVDIDLTRDARKVVFKTGEAYFKVARDVRRPFVVDTAEGRITALGTAFNVRHLDDRTIVTVSEGRVSVENPGDAHVATLLVEGQQLTLGAQGLNLTQPRAVDPKVATAWAKGRLKYNNEPLKFVVEDLERYTLKKLVIADAGLGDLHYTGTVLPAEIDEWLDSIQQAFPVAVRHEPDGTLVLVNPQPAQQ